MNNISAGFLVKDKDKDEVIGVPCWFCRKHHKKEEMTISRYRYVCPKCTEERK